MTKLVACQAADKLPEEDVPKVSTDHLPLLCGKVEVFTPELGHA